MNSLNTSQIAELTTSLEQLKTELKNQVELAQSATSTVVLDQSKVGRLSRVDALQQQHMADSTSQQAKKRLKLVQKALNKMPSEDYGYCELCDELIAFARLQATPEAQLVYVAKARKNNRLR